MLETLFAIASCRIIKPSRAIRTAGLTKPRSTSNPVHQLRSSGQIHGTYDEHPAQGKNRQLILAPEGFLQIFRIDTVDRFEPCN